MLRGQSGFQLYYSTFQLPAFGGKVENVQAVGKLWWNLSNRGSSAVLMILQSGLWTFQQNNPQNHHCVEKIRLRTPSALFIISENFAFIKKISLPP